jgi:hypothetical protein
MLTDAEYIIRNIAIGLLVLTTITGIAFFGSARGHYNLAVICCAWVPICFALYVVAGAVYSALTELGDFDLGVLLVC